MNNLENVFSRLERLAHEATRSGNLYRSRAYRRASFVIRSSEFEKILLTNDDIQNWLRTQGVGVNIINEILNCLNEPIPETTCGEEKSSPQLSAV